LLKHLSICLIPIAFIGCGGSTPVSSPMAPTPLPTTSAPVPAPTAPRPTFTLSGIVFEVTSAGEGPVEGVEVYCDSCGVPDGHSFRYTDSSGFYSFDGVYDGNNPLLVRKAGYRVIDPVRTFPDGTGVRNAEVSGNTSYNIAVER